MPWARSLRAEYPPEDHESILHPYTDEEDIWGVRSFFSMVLNYQDLCFDPGNDEAFTWRNDPMGMVRLAVDLLWEVRYGRV